MSATTRRWTAGTLCTVLALGTLAPAALAGRGPGSGYKVRARSRGHQVIERVVYPQRGVIVHRSSSNVAPVLAGLIGGFVLGTAVAHAGQPAIEASSYYYWDPYCEERMASLDRYEWHLRHSHHPAVVRVIDVRSGECMRREIWRDGGWRCDDNWRGDEYGRGRDRGRYDGEEYDD